MALRCQVCGNEKLRKIIDLGKQPPSDAFVTEAGLKRPENKYPLEVYYCEKCDLVQLGHAVEPEELFGEGYIYQTGFSIPLKEHLFSLTKSLVERFGLGEKNLVIDIGANDGTLLEGYLPYKVRVLGIEPSSVYKVAAEKGIPVIKGFFDENLAQKILEEHGRTKVITATNVFAHVRDLESFVKGVKILLEDDGAFVTESHYLLNLIEKLEYDTIYHEHLRYYSLESLISLFDKFGMDVFDAELVPTHGGSILAFACKRGAYPISESVRKILESEEKSKLNSLQTFEEFRKRVEINKKKLRELLLKIKSEGKRIVGIGAPAKSTTLLNFCGIDSSILDYVVERNEWKIGRYTPGTYIKISNESVLFEEQPEYAILLSWNLKDDIVPKLRKNGYKGKIIVPIPEPKIIQD